MRVSTTQERFWDSTLLSSHSPPLIVSEAAATPGVQLHFLQLTLPLFPKKFPSPLNGHLEVIVVFDGTGVVFLSSHFTKPKSLASRPTKHLFLPICPPARVNQFSFQLHCEHSGTGIQLCALDHPPTSPPTQSQELFHSHPNTHILPEVAQPLLVLPLCLPHPHSRLDLGQMFKHLDSGSTC